MKEVILVAVVLCIFAFGFFVMMRLDKFLETNCKHIDEDNDIKGPSFIMLTEEMTTDEMITEIKKYRNQHTKMRIIMYDGTTQVELHGLGYKVK